MPDEARTEAAGAEAMPGGAMPEGAMPGGAMPEGAMPEGAMPREDGGRRPQYRWPELTSPGWPGTRDTLLLWTQVVGKVRLALEPMVNHWWQVPLYVSARGLTTGLMPAVPDGLAMELDFVDQVVDVRTTAGTNRQVPLQPQSVASFYAATMAAVAEVGVAVRVRPTPVELPVAVPFPDDTTPRAYDPEAARQFWLALVQARRVMTAFRSRFIGKASPVHLFWGAMDLAVTRFSGRTAPPHPGGVPNCPDWVQQLAYSHEVSSCGFWPGGDGEGGFYAYAYPQPDGFADWPVRPAAAYYDADLGEFVLPYQAVRTAADPDGTLMAFLQSTYEAAAELAGWDRAALEVAAS
ncbi:MAG TPA: DUF5996 family protein [Acidimicrobiales bacterium]|nr:DUF5996 family protein [Acidimicrobiales bacterium]